MAGDVDNDGYDDLFIGAYQNGDSYDNAGAAYLALGPITGTVSLSAADAAFTGAAEDDRRGLTRAQGMEWIHMLCKQLGDGGALDCAPGGHVAAHRGFARGQRRFHPRRARFRTGTRPPSVRRRHTECVCPSPMG